MPVNRRRSERMTVMSDEAILTNFRDIVGAHIAAINALEADIQRPEGEASEKRWVQARHVAEALEGMSTRELAAKWKKPGGGTYSHAYVAYTAKTWELFGAVNLVDTSFYVAFNSDEVRKAKAHVGHNAGQSEWYTPEEYIVAAVRVMGGIDLDPASTVRANEIIGATTFYTAEEDGLAKPWEGRVWLNPPYAQPLVEQFCRRLVEEYGAGKVTQSCALVNNATETAWFQGLAAVASGLCFPQGRVKFWHPERESAPLQGQTVVYMGPNPVLFRREFGEFGFTATI